MTYSKLTEKTQIKASDIQEKYPSARLMELLREVKIMNTKLLTYLKTFLAIILLSGCTASWHVKQALRKDPSLFVTRIDTIRDTVFIKVASIDTVFKYNFDTVEYYQDKVFIKYHYDTLTNDVFISADCPDNEIVTNTVTKTETVTIKPTFLESAKYAIYLIVVILFVGVLYKVVRLFI